MLVFHLSRDFQIQISHASKKTFILAKYVYIWGGGFLLSKAAECSGVGHAFSTSDHHGYSLFQPRAATTACEATGSGRLAGTPNKLTLSSGKIVVRRRARMASRNLASKGVGIFSKGHLVNCVWGRQREGCHSRSCAGNDVGSAAGRVLRFSAAGRTEPRRS